MRLEYQSVYGPVSLSGLKRYHSRDFGYTLFEGVDDPRDPGGIPAFAECIPKATMTKIWEYLEPGYSESVELLAGAGQIAILKSGAPRWDIRASDPSDPFFTYLSVDQGDMYCMLAGDEDMVMLHRPSKPFELSFERVVANHPADLLAQYVQLQAAA